MSGTKRLSRTALSPQERRLRSELRTILNTSGLLHGSLICRERVCGKPNCRCTRGHKHRGLYLVVTEGGQSRQVYVPKQWEPLVRQWIDQYGKARKLMDEISRIYWQKVRERQE